MKPSWLNKREYPFAPNYIETGNGKMHYVDEGNGEPIVFVHGTPAWSFLYRNMIKELQNDHRCIAPDHLGFGLSEKPENFSYRVKDHAQNFERFIEYLDLKPFTLVVHDFGGPIALNYAIRHPEKIKKLVILNTWLWALDGEKDFVKGYNFFKGWIGKLLFVNFGFSPKVLMKMAFYDKSKLSKEIHAHYKAPFSEAAVRKATWVFARELIEASDFYQQLWEQRETVAKIPTRIIWGEKDMLIPDRFAGRLAGIFENVEVTKLEAGHFLQEEKPGKIIKLIKKPLYKEDRDADAAK